MLNNRSLNELNQMLDLKVLELLNKLSNENMKLWLQKEWVENKNEVMKYVDQHASLEDELFKKRLSRYMNYFSVLEKETDESKKVEYVFNYLTEIPAQLYNYVLNK